MIDHPKNWADNCSHRDTFNTRNHNTPDLPVDRSVVHEYDGELICGACNRKVTKKAYEKSMIPVTDRQMRDKRYK